MNILAFDVGGTFIKWGIVNLPTYEIIENGKFPTNTNINSGEDIINLLITKTQDLISQSSINGVGISMPGAINSHTSTVVGATVNIPESQGLNIQAIFNKQLPDINVAVANDVNVAALGELACGNLADETNALMMTLGTGIGGAIIINGSLYEGSSFLAGEIGRQFVQGEKWETIASTKALIELMKQSDINISSGEEIFKLIDSNIGIQNIYSKWLNYVVEGVGNLISILNPNTIVIGGGITEEENFNTDDIKQRLNNFLSTEFVNSVTIRKAKLGNKAAIIGAAKLWNTKFQ